MNIESEHLESIVKRYVLDQLDEQEAEEFEVFFLSRPDVADMIETAQNMRIGLVNHANTTASQTKPVDQESTNRRSFVERISQLLTGPVPAFAMLALLVGMTPLAFKGMSMGDQASSIELVMLDTGAVRSSAGNKTLDLSANGKHAGIVIRVAQIDYPLYRLRVTSASKDNEIWQSDAFAFASGSRDQLIVIPPSAAKSGVQVSLLGISDAGDESEVEFCNYTEACF